MIHVATSKREWWIASMGDCMFFYNLDMDLSDKWVAQKSIRKTATFEIRMTSHRHRWPQSTSMNPHKNSVLHSTIIMFHNTIFPFLCVKVKATLWHAYSCIEERCKYNSNLFAASSLEGDGCSPPAPCRFTPSHNQYLIYSRLGRLRGRGWTDMKNFAPTGNRTLVP